MTFRWQILLVATVATTEGLRRITISRNELSHPPESREWIDNYPSTVFLPPAPPSDYAPSPPATEQPYVPIQQYQPTYNYNYRPIPVPEFNQFEAEEYQPETTTHRPYLRKVKVSPRGGKNLKQTYQHLTPVAEQATTEVYFTEPIGATEPPQQEWTHEQIMGLCSNAYTTASNFGIHNFDSQYANANCGLIRMYYPGATCKEIETFMIYCDKHRARS